ncbi:L,D-transpeptidase [Paenibacillus segetis]|uniref:L,D-TPase catalytic domain-containing protein n=1 Tax=Paenibacillus segetis TaxID=1325360 RepID=A0ABQ1Y9H7_9BACL|nr:L,D-transpeptidase [Paenibacillus segetis]GGH15950.1 hypothetical protein GCM10008013_10470 [Paenibacillus segetis]
MKNSAYLKTYVENHPKNKMAWYLLGKEYEATGQEGKAHYCYMQAGSVYEAFESSKVTEEMWDGYKAGLLQESHRAEKRGRLVRKIGVIILFALLLWTPSAHAPGEQVLGTGVESIWVDQEEPKQDDNDIAGSSNEIQQTNSDSSEIGPFFTAKGYSGSADDRMKALGGLLDASTGGVSSIQVLAMGRTGNWFIWNDDMPVVYGIDRNKASGKTTLQSYDQVACRCAPPDTSKLQKAAKQWISSQESLVVLSSAMKHFKERSGQWPTELSELNKPFPNNWIAGNNEVMKQSFKPLLSLLQNSKGDEKNTEDVNSNGKVPNGKSSASQGKLSEGEGPYFTEPLEVIIDLDQHRLAVVSGSVMLRSYPVGLGGDRTPEGTYKISEKVVNPNGRDDGDFGSRGMQLSDTNYAIHGTNEPNSIGKDESLGCIRMNKQDVEELFDLLPMGTKVKIGKGILSDLEIVPKQRFALVNKQDQSNPHRTYHWLD